MIGIPARNIDDALDRVGRTRERLLADRAVAGRAERLAMSFESEARAWSQLYELAEERIVWRAALAAELAARRQGRLVVALGRGGGGTGRHRDVAHRRRTDQPHP